MSLCIQGINKHNYKHVHAIKKNITKIKGVYIISKDFVIYIDNFLFQFHFLML